jgi:hypothetical protein
MDKRISKLSELKVCKKEISVSQVLNDVDFPAAVNQKIIHNI